MSELWPRLSFAESAGLYASGAFSVSKSPTSHPQQVFAPTGGYRVTPERIATLNESLTKLATEFGFPAPARAAGRIGFDRAAARILKANMDISGAEASTREVWNFLSLVPLHSLTDWRFGRNNRERWIASDLTRHAWSRLWWHATVFETAEDLLDRLSESDLNQLLERRALGGDRRLTVALGREIVGVSPGGEGRREVIRDATARIRRRLAFADTVAMSPEDLRVFCASVVGATVSAVAARQR